MHHSLSPALKDLLAGIRNFIDREVRPLETENWGIVSSGDMNQTFFDLRREVQRRSVKAGYHAMFMPEEAGGAGLGEFEMCFVRELVYGTDSHLAVMLIGDLPYGPNKMLGALATDFQREKYLLPLMRAEVTTGIAITEPGAGSDIGAISTTASKTSSGWLINGTKHFISNGPFADFLQVLARAEKHGPTMLLVDRSQFEIGSLQHSMGGEDLQAEILFRDSLVPYTNVIGAPGEAHRYAMQYLSLERLSMSSIAIGMANLALRLAWTYARERRTFGRPIIENQAIQWMLADSETELYAARAMCYDAAQRADRKEDVFREVSMVKLFCSEMAGRVVDRALQIFGGAGYIRGSSIERLYRLVRVLRIGAGTSEMQRLIIALMPTTTSIGRA